MITEEQQLNEKFDVEFFKADGQIAKRFILSKGDKITTHINPYSHLSLLGYGSLRVDTPKRSLVHDIGDCIVITAHTVHTITALEDSCWFCIFQE